MILNVGKGSGGGEAWGQADHKFELRHARNIFKISRIFLTKEANFISDLLQLL
jgi:hypothetical protein